MGSSLNKEICPILLLLSLLHVLPSLSESWSEWSPTKCSMSCDYKPTQTRYRICYVISSSDAIVSQSNFSYNHSELCYPSYSSQSSLREQNSLEQSFDTSVLIGQNQTEKRSCRHKDSTFCIAETDFNGNCGTRKTLPVKIRPPTSHLYHQPRELAFDTKNKNHKRSKPGRHQSRRTKTPGFEKRIILGISTKKNAWPWFVALLYQQRYVCGGVLIDKQWILTAGHCVKDREVAANWEVKLGDHIKYVSQHASFADRRAISELHLHPSYFKIANHSPRYDVAMMKLKGRKVNYTHSINRVCLPNKEIFTTSFCYAIGFGMIDWPEKRYPTSLKEAHIPKRSDKICRVKYSNEYVRKAMLCAGSLDGTRDTCIGDSGGPLMCKHSSGQWYLEGIISWGVECGKRGWPGVYARVSTFYNWITSFYA